MDEKTLNELRSLCDNIKVLTSEYEYVQKLLEIVSGREPAGLGEKVRLAIAYSHGDVIHFDLDTDLYLNYIVNAVRAMVKRKKEILEINIRLFESK